MIRVSSLEDTIAFFEVPACASPPPAGRERPLHLRVPRRPGDEAAAVELIYNWDPQPYPGGRIRPSRLCRRKHLRHLQRPDRPRRDDQPPAARRPDVRFRTPDNISIELLQAGEALSPAEPWTSSLRARQGPAPLCRYPITRARGPGTPLMVLPEVRA